MIRTTDSGGEAVAVETCVSLPLVFSNRAYRSLQAA